MKLDAIFLPNFLTKKKTLFSIWKEEKFPEIKKLYAKYLFTLASSVNSKRLLFSKYESTLEKLKADYYQNKARCFCLFSIMKKKMTSQKKVIYPSLLNLINWIVN